MAHATLHHRSSVIRASNFLSASWRVCASLLPVIVALASCCQADASPPTTANRLVDLDDCDPFYPQLNLPRLTTPQWVGDAGVEEAVILAIDDMQAPGGYETFLRPILERLKQIDGRAPVSIMCKQIEPNDPHYQQWLKEGLSLEVHTLTHPCPILGQSNFQAAAATFFGSIANVDRVPGNQAAAFRTPCCDSINSPSPRLFAELFNRVNDQGQFLTIDSSVMDILSKKDTSLPAELVSDADGRDKFQKYIPFASFQTTIENYPFPYVIGRLCWEFPPVPPSDWEAFHLQGAFNPATLADWKAALDATLLKQGVLTLIFHPHGWIRNEQVRDLVDYADRKYRAKVKFLNFREAQQRINQNLLDGQPLRASNGEDNGVRLIDLNNDGFMDVVIGNEQAQKTRIWNPKEGRWIETDFPTKLVTADAAGHRHDAGVRFGVMTSNGCATLLVRNETTAGAWTFDGQQWIENRALLNGLELDGKPVYTSLNNRDRGVRLRDLEHNGLCNLIVGNESQNAVFSWSAAERRWKQLPYSLPPQTSIVDAEGNDNGLRFIDINGDGFDDVIFSNPQGFSVHLFVPKPVLGFGVGWSRAVVAGKPGDPGQIPMIVRGGAHPNNGAWFHSEGLWVQNEDTAHLPDLVDRRSFKEMVAGIVSAPKSPQDSLACITVRPGFKVELVASEPLTKSPIAFDWGADGKFWVVEMGDYPLGLDGKGKPGGVVRYLEDTKGDGHYDKSTVFLDGLPFPTGILAWRKGVIVCDPPEIFYAESSSNEGKADTRVTLFTGFIEGNQQHRANGFDYGLDNWIYGANGNSGGIITSKLTGKSVNISGRDFRFRPGSGAFETQPGQAQYGRHRDDWGNWFGIDNSSGPWHYFLPEQYLARNPFLSVGQLKQVMPDYDDFTRVYPTSRLTERFNDPSAANHLTSANSPVPYRDDLFGPDFARAIFVSEPVHNLVHRENLVPAGVSFTSLRAPDEAQSEFFASSDNWTRPTMTKTGPDGAFYIADMYRLIIEHPQWIPGDVQKSVDLRAGADKGRIYRVYPADAKLRPVPRLDKLDTAGLVAALDNPNGWQRDTVQRLLADSGDRTAVAPLEKLALASPRPKVRLQALCTLDGLGALTPEIVIQALMDTHASVREQAVRISESFLQSSPQVGPALLGLTNDPQVRVRYQLAFTLGNWPDPRAGAALAEIALQDKDDARVQTAVMSSAPGRVSEMLTAVLAHQPVQAAQGALLEGLAGLAASLNDQPALTRSLAAIVRADKGRYESWQYMALNGLLDALRRRGIPLAKFRQSGDPEFQQTLSRLDDVFAAASRAAMDPAAAVSDRLPAIALLGRGLSQQEDELDSLGKLLLPQNPQNIQKAALDALGQFRGPRVGAALVAAWKRSSPATRRQLLDALLSRPEWINELVGAIETGKIAAGALSIPQQQTLLAHGGPAMRQRAGQLFAASNPDRQAVVKRYQGLAHLPGDPARGRPLFRQNCTPCHRLENEGNALGPDLGSVAFKPVDYLMIAILDPNQSVEERYLSYNVVTKNDQEYTGIVTAETANSVTLRIAGGAEIPILRSDLKELTSTGRSLMPDGFENSLNPQALADVIAYINRAPSSAP